MTLNQLSYFIATCNNGNSMTKASRELFVTQSAISLAIRDLEREFNVQLFFRNKNQLYLTEAGRKFFELAKQVVDSAERLRDTYQEELSHSPGMRVGMTPLVHKMVSYCIPLNEWGRFSPYAIQSTYILDTITLRQLIDSDEIDLMVVGSSRYDDLAKYDSATICDRYIYLYTANTNPLAAYRQISPEQLSEEPILCYLENADGISSALKTLQRFIPNLQLNCISGYTTSLNVVEDFVGKANGSALLSEGVICHNEKIKMLPITGCRPYQVMAFWKKERGLSAAANRYIEYLCHVFQQE